MELKCNMAFRGFVGLDIDSRVWDDTTFSKNREHRFDDANIFETLFDDTVKRAVANGWVSDHWSIDGTLVRANASHKSFVPIELHQSPEQFRETISGKKRPSGSAAMTTTKAIQRWIGAARSAQTRRTDRRPTRMPVSPRRMIRKPRRPAIRSMGLWRIAIGF